MENDNYDDTTEAECTAEAEYMMLTDINKVTEWLYHRCWADASLAATFQQLFIGVDGLTDAQRVIRNAYLEDQYPEIKSLAHHLLEG